MEEYTIESLALKFSEHAKKYEEERDKWSEDFNLPRALMTICEQIILLRKDAAL